MLSERILLKRIAMALNISDSRMLKRLMTKALGQKFRVFDKFTIEELSNKIQAFLPIREHRANWGIFHVKVALGRLCVRPPRKNIARALQVLLGIFYSLVQMLINFIFYWSLFIYCFILHNLSFPNEYWTF